MHRITLLCILAISLWAPSLSAAPEVSSGDAFLALRLADLAKLRLDVKSPGVPNFRQAAALLEAAGRLDPTEPRYPRLLADTLLQIGDGAAAIDALVAFRKLRPGDQAAQLELIGLYLDRLESAEKKLDYLAKLRVNPGIPAEVRSAVAVRNAELLFDRGDDRQADAVVAEALKLDPLNYPALVFKLRGTDPADAASLFATRLAMVRANPGDSDSLTTIARTTADAGLVEESLQWYTSALISGPADPQTLMLEYASQLLVADQIPEARKRIDAILRADPESYAGLVLRLLLDRRENQKESAEAVAVRARNVLLNRLAQIRKAVGAPDAAQGPAGEGALAAPALEGDLELVKKLEDPALRNDYLQAVGDLAWFEVYFNNRPDEAEKYLTHFSQLADEKNVFAARTAGWILLAQEKPEEAKVKLSAAAPADPFASLGLIKLAGADPAAKADAAKLLSAFPSGFTGAFLADALRETGVKVTPGPAAAPMAAALKAFPRDWLRVLENPRAFYSIRAEPLKVSHDYGEPMWVRVTVTNTSQYDIRIAPDGAVKPALWFQLQLQGQYRNVPPVNLVERLTESLVLRPRQTITLAFRADQTELTRHFESNPVPPVPLAGVVRSNPLYSDGSLYSTAGGYDAPFTRPMERAASPLSAAVIKRVTDSVAKGGREKLLALELLQALYRVMRGAPADNEDVQKVAATVRQVMDDARNEGEPSVRAWASLLYGIGPAGDPAPVVQRMVGDASWVQRLVGASLAPTLPADRAQSILTDLAENDADPAVKALAASTLRVMAQTPATQPAVPVP